MIKGLRAQLRIYEESLKARGMTGDHIRSIRYQIEVFLAYVRKKRLRAMTRRSVSDYRDYLFRAARDGRGKALEERLRLKRLSALMRFFYDLTQRGVFLLNPARDLELPRLSSRFPRFIPSHESLRLMIEKIEGQAPGELRDRALLELLYSTGLRARELLRLSLYDLDLEGDRVIVREGKSRKDRVVPLGRKAKAAVQQYLKQGRPALLSRLPTTLLFLALHGGRPLSYPALIRVFKRHRPDPRITPHTLRHACALGMLRGGADIRFIQELLGHERLETTQIYTRIFPAELKAIHERFHPRGWESHCPDEEPP